ncbi:MAG: hypothetical protein ACKO2S_09040 [Burkholderiaceae bacterium]
MSVSHTNHHQPQQPTTVPDNTDSNSTNTSLTQGKKRSASSLSSFTVDSVVNAREAKSPDAITETQSGPTKAPSMSTPQRFMAIATLVNPAKQPMPVDLSQILASIALPSPPATGIIPPAQYYPSSQPVLKSYPVWPNRTVDQITLPPLAPLCATTQTRFNLPPLMANNYGSLALTPPSFQSPNNLHQPLASIAAPDSLIDADDQRPAKRRKINEGIGPSIEGNSSPTTEFPVWHQTKLAREENLDPYIKFLGLEAKEGQQFVSAIFDRSKNGKDTPVKERIDLCEKLFRYLSIALEKRLLGLIQISDDELGKLIISSFLVIRTNSTFLKYQYENRLDSKLIELVYTFINNHHSLVPYIKSGIRFDGHAYDGIFDGKAKCELILWCAEQGILLNQDEIKFLSKHPFRTKTPPGQAMLLEFRFRVKEQLQKESS